jgi:Na+/H+-translocating membrane pyrophosphatase
MAGIGESNGVDDCAKDPQPYYGYDPKCPQDFPFDEDNPMLAGNGVGHIVDANMLRDQGRSSKALILGMAFFGISAIVLFVWIFLLGGAGECKVSQLCDTRDRSSYIASESSSRKFDFLVPTKLLWISMFNGTIVLLLATLYAFSVVGERVGTSAMAEMACHIRNGAQLCLSRMSLVAMAPIVSFFVLLVVGPGWRVAGGFGIGALLVLITSYSNSKISLAGNVRTTAALLSGLVEALKVGLSTGSAIGLSIVSVGIVGLSSSYLMFQDVRCLAGFAFGVSTVALLAKISGGIFSKAADIGAGALVRTGNTSSEDDRQNPTVVADLAGDVIGSVFAGSADCFETFAASIAATALLGSSLPFFQRNQFAMCVFNHLYVDNRCGLFGYPQQLSYASYLCKTNDFYLKYPRLSVWQSNAAFVALPFLLASVGILASAIATACARLAARQGKNPEDLEPATSTVVGRIQKTNILAVILVVFGSAALCFLLFGRKSMFQQAAGLGQSRNLPVFKLSNDEAACVNTFVLPGESDNPVALPSGALTNSGRYSPVSTLGFEFGDARRTPWRLFGCILIGLLEGQLINVIAIYFTTAACPPAHAAARCEKYGAGAFIIQVFGSGMMSTLSPMVIVVASVLATYNLFEFYGIALCSVAVLSTLGINMSNMAIGPVADNAIGIARMSQPATSPDNFSAGRGLNVVGNVLQSTGKSYLNVASIMTTCGVVAALVNESGLTPSSRDLVGTPRVLGRVLQSSSTLVDTYVVASIFIGFMIPYILTGVLLTSVYGASRTVVYESRKQRRDCPEILSAQSGALPNYSRCVQHLTRVAITEMVIPFIGVILTPLILGFGFGQKALVGVLVAAIASSFLLSSLMIHSGEAWDTFKNLLESDSIDNKAICGPATTEAVSSGDMIGDAFKDTAAPCLSVSIKTMTTVGLVSVSLMEPDGRDGWIGAVLMAAFVVIGAAYSIWRLKDAKVRQTELRQGETEENGGRTPAPPKKVSPFYINSCTWGVDNVVPGSQMHEALEASEQQHGSVDPRPMPGLSDRSSMDREKLQELKQA